MATSLPPADRRAYAEAIRRAAPPEFMFPADLVGLFGLADEATARAAIERGDFGPYSTVGDILVIRRASLVEHLRSIEVCPAGPAIEYRGGPRRVEFRGRR